MSATKSVLCLLLVGCGVEPGPLSGYVELEVDPALVDATSEALAAWEPLPLTVEIVDRSSPYAVTFGDLRGVDETGHTESSPWTAYRTVYVNRDMQPCAWPRILAHELGHFLTGEQGHPTDGGVMLSHGNDKCKPWSVTEADRRWLATHLDRKGDGDE